MKITPWLQQFRQLVRLSSQSSRRTSGRVSRSREVEALEDRALLATFTVSNLNDAGAGSLRQAVLDANAAGGTDVIDATGVTGTITLTTGQLEITGSVTVNGPGADQLVVSGNDSSRIFLIGSNAESGDYTINDLTIANGEEDSSTGGGIFFADNVNRLFLNRTTVRDNHANGAGGLAVAGTGGVDIMDSAFINNSANFGGAATIISAASNNWIMNSTFSGNTSDSGQGTIETQAGSGQTQITRLRNLTITNNTSVGVGNFAFDGGVVTLEVSNTILSGNSADNITNAMDGTGVATIVSTGDNISDDASAGFVSGDLTSTDPLLGPLADNGGPTFTHALLAGSPAIDGGDNATAIDRFANRFVNDQRQGPFRRTYDSDNDGTSTIDVGAFEYYGILTVDAITDVEDDNYDAGEFSLRETLTIANAQPGSETIGFDTTGTITLNSGLEITDSVSIEGPGAGDLAVSGDNTTRVLFISNSDASFIDVSISGLTITGGNTTGRGAGIENLENLTLRDFSARDNNGTGDGGGLRHDDGALTVLNSTFADNSAGQGGGIAVGSGTAQIINSTFSGNASTLFGGGILVFTGSTTIRNSTFVGNRSDSDGNDSGDSGGGIDVNPGTTTLHNNIVAGNFSGTGTTPADLFGSYLAGSSFNLIGAAGSAGNLTNGNNGNIVGNAGTGTITTSTILETTLANNGGPTQTHALVPGSLALDAGDNSAAVDSAGDALTTDQRGFLRPVGTVDIGAVEVPFAGALIVSTATDVVDGDYSFGELSLREAVIAANRRAGADSITFSSVIANQQIKLELGELLISDDVSIQGLGSGESVIVARDIATAADNSRLIHVTSDGGDVTLDGLTLAAGKVGSGENGGGILFESMGTLTVSNAVISGNEAESQSGGGIYSSGGAVVVTGSEIVGNNAQGSGGGIASLGDVTVTDSLISGNGSFATSISAGGGGIFVGGSGQITVTGSEISSNTSSGEGGGIRLFNTAGSVTVDSTTISGNSAIFGGGVSTDSANISNSTLNENNADLDGGAFFTFNGTVSIVNTTISGNVAGQDGVTESFGGGLFANISEVSIVNSTITLNQATEVGGGVYMASNRLTAVNSIFANNTDEDGEAPDLRVLAASVTFSLIGDNAGTDLAESPTPDASTGNIVGSAAGAGVISAGLGALQDNGGTTHTHALLFGSPAIDVGSNNRAVDVNSVALANEQRGSGFARIIDGHADNTATVDLGAFEFTAPVLSVAVSANSISENGGSTTATVSRTGDTSAALMVTLSSDDTTEATVPGTVTIAAGQTTSPAFTITAVDDSDVDGSQTATITASVSGAASGSDTVDVTDNDVASRNQQNIASDASNPSVLPGGTISIPVVYRTLNPDGDPVALQASLISFNLHFDSTVLTFVETTDIFAEGIQVVPNSTRLESDVAVTGDDNDIATDNVLVASYSDNDSALNLGWPNNSVVDGQVLYIAHFTAAGDFSGTTINFSANAVGTVVGESEDFSFSSESVTVGVSENVGNVDGDDDFDANDAFLIQLVQLAGSNTQIDQSKGASSLSAAEIRANIAAIGLAGDVDGDSDFDANDSFLIQLVKLAGSDTQIDQSKGASPLLATQIRANVNSLGGGNTGQQATASLAPQLADVNAEAEQDHPDLFAPASNSSTNAQYSTPSADMVETDEVWTDFRSWVDAL